MYMTIDLDGNKLIINAMDETYGHVGYLYVDIKEDALEISEIGVLAEFRERGIANAMIDRLISFMEEANVRLPISVCYPLEDETEALNSLLISRHDFVLVEQGIEYSCKVSEICQGTQIKKFTDRFKNSTRIVNIRDCKSYVLTQVIDSLNSFFVPVVETPGQFDSEYSYDISYVYMDKENKNPLGCILAEKDDNNKLIILKAAFSCDPKDLSFALLVGRFFTAIKDYGDYTLVLSAVTKESEALCNKLVEGGLTGLKKVPFITGVYRYPYERDILYED